jgi:hypothetical protein
MKVFIGGSRRISQLNIEVKKRLQNIIDQSFTVLIGDAKGADKAVQKFFVEKRYSEVIIYCSGSKCRNNLGGWPTVNIEVKKNLKGIAFYMIKDERMAVEADYGFMLWDGKSAGTLNNILNLLKQQKNLLLYFLPKKQLLSISSLQQLNDVLNFCKDDDKLKIDKKIGFYRIIEEMSSAKQLTLPL